MSDSNSPTAAVQERVLTDPLRRLSTEKDMDFLMLGLDGAGKTTIMKRFDLGLMKCDSLGSHIESVKYNNITIDAWDLSGEKETRNPGRYYFKNTKGLIFVVDITDTDRLDRARRELHKMLLNQDLHKDVALLVYANKQDKHKGMKKEEIYERLGLSFPNGPRLGPCRHHVELTSAITGEGLYEGLDWLCQRISDICAITDEGITKGLNWLRNSSANKKDDDMARRMRDLEELNSRLAAYNAKERQLEEDLRNVKMKKESCRRELGDRVQSLIKHVRKEADEQKEARRNSQKTASAFSRKKNRKT